LVDVIRPAGVPATPNAVTGVLLCRWPRKLTGRDLGMIRRRVRAKLQRSRGIRLR
jgi:hypothetical protein